MPARPRRTRPLLMPLLLGVLAASPLAPAPSATAGRPLHARIDQLVAAQAGGKTAPTSDDAEFLRRVYLDFAGRIPSVTETRTFLATRDPDKRMKLIEGLSDSPEYASHMTEFLHVMLMERMGDDESWRLFLETSLSENKPWDFIVRQILHPNTDDEKLRGAAFFFTKRLEKYGQNPVDMPGLVRDVGRLFLGVDVQCAECHDHLFVDDYKQDSYQGLFAFVGHTFIRRDVEFPAIGENLLTKKVDFKSVFVMEDRTTGPKLLAAPEVQIPDLAKGEEYLVAPDKKTRFPGTPKFSPLAILAEQLPTRGNQAFEENIVNRLWWKLMGHGLVDPLDLHHSQNPPSHPELMGLLVQEFGEHEFDMKWLLRQLARSQTYQRSSRMATAETASEPETPHARTSYRRGLERALSAEQLLASAMRATGPAMTECNAVADSSQTASEQEAAARPTIDELREKFKTVLANPPREPEIGINPTVKAALFLMNDESVLQMLEPCGDNLIARLSAMESADQIASELYLSVLSRPPNAKEQTEVAEYLALHADHCASALADLAWALLASVEFCVNH